MQTPSHSAWNSRQHRLPNAASQKVTDQRATALYSR